MEKDMNNTTDTNTRKYESRSTGPKGACQQAVVSDCQVLFLRPILHLLINCFDEDYYSFSQFIQ